MKHIVTLAVLFILVLSVPAEAEIAFGSGTEGTLYSGDGVCQVSALFGSALAITPGEILREEVRIRLPEGGRLYLLCPGLPKSLEELKLTVQGDGLIFQGELGSADWIYLGNFSEDTDQPVDLILKVPENLTDQGRRDWQGLHWYLTKSLPQMPPTGDVSHPEAAAGILAGSTLGLLCLLLGEGAAPRRRMKGGR